MSIQLNLAPILHQRENYHDNSGGNDELNSDWIPTNFVNLLIGIVQTISNYY
jgi:hypothetical protein